MKKPEAVGGRAGEVLDRVLRVRHEADDPAVLAGDAGDVPARAVGVALDVAGDDPALALEAVEVGVGRHVPALAVLDRDDDALAVGVGVRPGGVGALDAQRLVAVAEVQVAVAGQRAGQQAGLAEHLEAVADAEHRHALARPSRRRPASAARGRRWPRPAGSRRRRSRRGGRRRRRPSGRGRRARARPARRRRGAARVRRRRRPGSPGR